MDQVPITTVDLSRLTLAHGDGRRLDLPVRLGTVELGGQTYEPRPQAPTVRLEVSRPSSGFAFRLRFAVRLEGPCMRCLEPAGLEVEVESREVDQPSIEDRELRSPYVSDDELDLSRWAHDALVLALPTQILCREDCLGLCPGCGEPLNDADPANHEHETVSDPRWAALDDLKLE